MLKFVTPCVFTAGGRKIKNSVSRPVPTQNEVLEPPKKEIKIEVVTHS